MDFYGRPLPRARPISRVVTVKREPQEAGYGAPGAQYNHGYERHHAQSEVSGSQQTYQDPAGRSQPSQQSYQYYEAVEDDEMPVVEVKQEAGEWQEGEQPIDELCEDGYQVPHDAGYSMPAGRVLVDEPKQEIEEDETGDIVDDVANELHDTEHTSADEAAAELGIPPAPVEEVDPGDGLGPLPPHYDFQYTASGRIYFLDHWRRTTTWQDPRKPAVAQLAAPKAELRTICKAFQKGYCPLKKNCLFLHVTKEEQEAQGLECKEDEDVTLEDKEDLPNPFAQRFENTDIKENVITDGDWRFAETAHDFEIGDRVLVVIQQESTEEYVPSQLIRLGEEGTVIELVPGGFFVRLKHDDGAIFSWRITDLLVLRPFKEVAPQAEVKKKKEHKWVKVNHQRRREAAKVHRKERNAMNIEWAKKRKATQQQLPPMNAALPSDRFQPYTGSVKSAPGMPQAAKGAKGQKGGKVGKGGKGGKGGKFPLR